jgi:outer membrane protein assembly factor BamB
VSGKPAGPCTLGDLDGDGETDILVLTTDGVLTAFDLQGNSLFVRETRQIYRVPPSVGDIDGDGTVEIVMADDTGVLRILSGETRQEEWGFQSEEGTTISRIALADVDGRKGMEVVFSTLSGAVFILEGNTGALLGFYNCDSYLFTTPLVHDVDGDRVNEIILTPYDGTVVALRMTDVDTPFFSFLVSRKTRWPSVHGEHTNGGHSRSRLATFISMRGKE